MQVQSDLPAGCGPVQFRGRSRWPRRNCWQNYIHWKSNPLRLAKICRAGGERIRRREMRVARPGLLDLRTSRAGSLSGLPFGGNREHPAAARRAHCWCSHCGVAHRAGWAANTTSGASNVSPPPPRYGVPALRDVTGAELEDARGWLDDVVYRRGGAHRRRRTNACSPGSTRCGAGGWQGVRRTDVRLARKLAHAIRKTARRSSTRWSRSHAASGASTVRG